MKYFGLKKLKGARESKPEERQHAEFVYENGDRYVGFWCKDRRDGYGIAYYGDGNQYKGNWKEDLKHGMGTYVFANGNTYCGEWRCDKRAGYGVARFLASGNQYEGDWIDDAMQGKGTFRWKNGDVYIGDWEQNRRTGTGTLIRHDSHYAGEWLNDQPHGKGLLVSTSTSTSKAFECEYNRGVRLSSRELNDIDPDLLRAPTVPEPNLQMVPRGDPQHAAGEDGGDDMSLSEPTFTHSTGAEYTTYTQVEPVFTAVVT